MDAAKSDLEASKLLTEKNLCATTLYHLQQSFEKFLKSFHIFKSATLEGLSSSQAKSKATGYSHNIEKSVIDLLVEITEFEKDIIERAESSGPEFEQTRGTLISKIDGFIVTIRDMPRRLKLDDNLKMNIQNYEQFVQRYYDKHVRENSELMQASPSDYIYFSFISCAFTIYPCLYKMETIARYPMKQFDDKNLELLNGQKRACMMLIELVSELSTIITREINRFSQNIANVKVL